MQLSTMERSKGKSFSLFFSVIKLNFKDFKDKEMTANLLHVIKIFPINYAR